MMRSLEFEVGEGRWKLREPLVGKVDLDVQSGERRPSLASHDHIYKGSTEISESWRKTSQIQGKNAPFKTSLLMPDQGLQLGRRACKIREDLDGIVFF
jgi:hypothetical protein